MKSVDESERRTLGPSEASDVEGVLAFLRAAERLKVVNRSAWTSAGRPESVAEHTWRVCLMAIVLSAWYRDIDVARLMKLCVLHDLGEAVSGDVPAPEQASYPGDKRHDERRDFIGMLAPLPEPLRREFTSLWDEYHAAETPEARLAKGLDKLETVLQHVQGDNPSDFDYRFNLAYGQEFMSTPLLAALRRRLDDETEQRARATDAEAGRH